MVPWFSFMLTHGVFILFLTKVILCVSVTSFLHLGQCEFLAHECLVFAKLYKQPEELVASRKWVVDATEWWMLRLILKWGDCPLLFRRGEPETKPNWVFTSCRGSLTSRSLFSQTQCLSCPQVTCPHERSSALPKRKTRNSDQIFTLYLK